MKRQNLKTIGIITAIIILIAIIITSIYFIIKKINKVDREYDIEKVSEYKYFVVKEKEKYGVINSQGHKIVETTYTDVKIPNPAVAIFICYNKENTEVLNEKGDKILTNYTNVEPLKLKNITGDLIYEKNVLKYSENGKYGLINFEGKILTKPIYQEIETLQYKEGELLVKKDNKYGVISNKGKTLVKTNYDKIEADKFYEGNQGYKKSGYIISNKTDEGYRYGYIDIEGEEILEIKYNEIFRITEIDTSEAYLIAAENGKYGMFKSKKQIIPNNYQSLTYNESNKTITALKGKKYGVIDLNGKEIIPTEYNQIDVNGDYIYATSSDGNVKVFGINGQEVNIEKNIQIQNIEDTNYKICIQTTQEGGTEYYLYKDNKKATNNKYKYIEYLYNNFFLASNEQGKLGVIDDSETEKIPFEYNTIQLIEDTKLIQATKTENMLTAIYSSKIQKICELKNAKISSEKNYTKIYNNDEIKYISQDEKVVTSKEIFTNNKIFVVKENGKYGYINANGEKVINNILEYAEEVNEYGFAGIKKNGKWGVINSTGQIILEPKYELNEEEPSFIGEYYKVVYGNGEILYTK